jgi:hypothetical protein
MAAAHRLSDMRGFIGTAGPVSIQGRADNSVASRPAGLGPDCVKTNVLIDYETIPLIIVHFWL